MANGVAFCLSQTGRTGKAEERYVGSPPRWNQISGGAQGPGVSSVVVVLGGTRRKVYFTVQLFS